MSSKRKNRRKTAPIPSPAHPHKRREPLPWQRPKAVAEDPDALRRIEAIQSSPTYRESDKDLDFLARYETRGLRLQLDYLKPELALEEQGVRHTIVVFGSTRIQEESAARRKVAEARAGLEADPSNAALVRRLAVAERLLAKSRYYEVARELGRIVGEANHGREEGRLVLMTGGGPGMMEAANRGAFESGARSIGLNIRLPHEQYPNPYITPDLAFRFHYFALRKLHFMLRARALVAFPGGYGTLDELFETLTLVQTRTIRPLPVVLVGEEYWRRAFDPDFLVDEGVVDLEDRDLFWFAETAQQIWDGILTWYAASGKPLLNDTSGFEW